MAVVEEQGAPKGVSRNIRQFRELFDLYSGCQESSSNEPPVLVGDYDLSKIPFKLGNFLLLSQNLEIVKRQLGASRVYVNIVTQNGFINRSLDRSNISSKFEFAKKILGLYGTVDDVYLDGRFEDETTFPPAGVEYDHKSYIFSAVYQENVGESVRTPYVHRSEKAKQLFHKNPKIICFHPKWDDRLVSNALLEEWEQIILSMREKYLAVVIGNDNYPADFKGRMKSNGVCFSQDLDFDVFDESFLITQGAGFIGIASGPSGFAILSDKPYLIIKHEADAWREKFEETQDHRLLMGEKNQFFVIGNENLPLVSEILQRWL